MRASAPVFLRTQEPRITERDARGAGLLLPQEHDRYKDRA
jgi:hypothetical protein